MNTSSEYNFDQLIERTETDCVKWDFIEQDRVMVSDDHAHAAHGADRVLPLWVADMDFRSPPVVSAALAERAHDGFFGYTMPGDGYLDAICAWSAARNGRAIEKEWIVPTPGIITALNAAIQAFTRPGEKVLIQPPVYHPFFYAIENNGRGLATNELLYEDGRYTMDFEDLARKTADPEVKLAVLCSPHNPIGRNWSAGELRRYAEICNANDVLVVADEIHCDLIMGGGRFTSYLSLGEPFADRVILCGSASKTFNLPGLKTAHTVIPNEELRQAFTARLTANGMSGLGLFGLLATQVAYNEGAGWLDAALAYIEGNFEMLCAFVAERLPAIKVTPLEGTYLAWLNFSALNMGPKTRRRWLLQEARLYLQSGAAFGRGGAGFERVNIACPRPVLLEALQRLERAIESS